MLRPGGVRVFTVIEAATGLSPGQRRRARRDGPAAVLTRTSYPSLLASAGFVDVEVTDRTAEYRATQQRWIDATVRHEAELRATLGDTMYEDRIVDRGGSLAAIDDGVLIRRLYVATRPTTSRAQPHDNR